MASLVSVLLLRGAVLAGATEAEGAPAPAPKSRPALHRFFLAGDGLITLENAHTGERLRVRFREADGSYSNEALARINRLLRSRSDGATTSMSIRLIEVIDYLEDEAKPSKILVNSGYRSPTYNASIIARGGGAAKSSMHTEGLATDLTFRGLKPRPLWEHIRALECCGVGLYEKGGFLHIDVGLPRFWEEATSRVGEDLSADNARVFARTRYDRYAAGETIDVRLHAVTLHPLRIEPRAELVPEGSSSFQPHAVPVMVEGGAPAEDGCLTVSSPKREQPVLRVSAGQGSGRVRIRLHTCSPRLGRTPATIDTNPLEIVAAAPGGAKKLRPKEDGMSELEGRVALVTGGGSGIGLGAARALAKAGARVTLMGRDDAKLHRAVESLGDHAWTVAGDVGREEDVIRVVGSVLARFGRLDVAVNAAGTGSLGTVVDQSAEDWAATLRTNLDGTMYCVKHEAAAMVQGRRGGSIVNISSIAGTLTHRLMSAYCVSKAGVEMLTRCAADELGEHRVRVNALRPGLVPTDLANPLVEHARLRADYESKMPLHRLGSVEDVAEAVLFLASERSAWITGQVIGVDGGHTLRGGPDIGLLFR